MKPHDSADKAAPCGWMQRLVRCSSFLLFLLRKLIDGRLEGDDVTDLHGLTNEFRRCQLRRDEESALATKLNNKAAWESIACALGKLPLAGGAMWGRDAVGDWSLYKPKCAKVESCVVELLNYLGTPIGPDASDCVDCAVGLRNLETLAKFGIALEMETLKACAKCIHNERESNSGLSLTNPKEYAKNSNPKANINDSGDRINSINPSLYKVWDHIDVLISSTNV